MKKWILLMAFVLVVATASTGAALAAKFAVGAEVPEASGVVFTITKINADKTWTNEHPTDLNFGLLAYDAGDKIFRPTKYFAIDLGVGGNGAGKPDNIQFLYEEFANPNADEGNGRGGLGKKATMQVVKATYADGDFEIGSQVLLENAADAGPVYKDSFYADAGTNSPSGWPRMYIGIYDGSDDNLNAAGWESFTSLDANGPYLGYLTITATVN